MAKIDPNVPITWQMLQEAIDAILGSIASVLDEVRTIKTNVAELKSDMQQVKVDVKWLKDDFEGIRAEFSDSVHRGQFEELKRRVTKLESTN